MQHPARTPAAPGAKREGFPDGSAIVTYADGGILIVETDLAREAVLQDSRSVNYNDPPPPPPLKEGLGLGHPHPCLIS